jgi:mono/diheme cytochrome c family protein
LIIRQIFVGVGILTAVIVAAFAINLLLTPTGPEPQPPIAGAPMDVPPAISHGQYLAEAADCAACHTALGGSRYAGGRPFQLPFGTIYSTNITPDPQTGIGGWSDDEFIRAVRDGIGPHGHLYPAMPYTSYAAMSRADLLAIKGYLFSLAPVQQSATADGLVFPFNQRWGMALWDLAFFQDQRYIPSPTHNELWNRGAYLATALGHCGECHTPRNIGFAMRSHDYLAGTIVQGWKAYNTTADASYGIGAWSDAQVEDYLWHGHAPGRGSAAGPMAEVVQNSLQYLTQSDINALVTYLRSVAPATNGQEATINLTPAAVGASSAILPKAGEAGNNLAHGLRLFEGDCAGCHQWNGVGRESDYAALVGSHAVNDPTGIALVQVLLHGSSLVVDGRTEMMPGFGETYSDADIAAIANYVLAHFGGKQGTVTAAQVATQRKQAE